LTSPGETSVEVEAAFTAALDAEGLLELADERATAALREAVAAATGARCTAWPAARCRCCPRFR
jgi:hypothetical protein